jgi:hypothetical protein
VGQVACEHVLYSVLSGKALHQSGLSKSEACCHLASVSRCGARSHRHLLILGRVLEQVRRVRIARHPEPHLVGADGLDNLVVGLSLRNVLLALVAELVLDEAINPRLFPVLLLIGDPKEAA